MGPTILIDLPAVAFAPDNVTQILSPPQLPPRSSPPPQTLRVRPHAYSIAVYLFGAVLLFELAMIISIFWFRAMVVPVNTVAPRALAHTSPRPSASLIPNPADARLPLALPSLPMLMQSATQPTLLRVPGGTDKLEQISSLNEQAASLTKQNEIHGALELLLKAEDLDPRNPTTLEHLAEASYAANDPVQAKIYWQRLVDLGQNVGTIYATAKDHLTLLDSTHEADPLRVASPLSLGRAVYIQSVEKTPIDTASGQAKFNVRTTLMRKEQKAVFDQKKLRPFVIFYQLMKDGSLAPDLAPHHGNFDDTFLFYSGKVSEALNVEYVLPIPGLPGPNHTVAGEYYGFVIGIYYNNLLEDARSEPSDLILRQPLPDAIE